MAFQPRSAPSDTHLLPQWQLEGVGLPTPPEEDEPTSDAMAHETMSIELEKAWRTIEDSKAHNNNLCQELEESKRPRARIKQAEECTCLSDRIESERYLWEAIVKELQLENQHLRHILYMSAPETSTSNPRSDSPDRSDTRTLRQQLACMNEHCQSLTDKAARLQEQTTEAQRLLSQERQERLEERNQQLTVVVAKHGLERRMRNREQDLQAEWQRNAQLSERCQKLEEDLARAKEVDASHGKRYDLPIRQDRYHRPIPTQEAPSEDEWTTDSHQHLPPEFGYSKFVRWKKRTREGHDRGAVHWKKQRTASPETGRLHLAGSESPPQLGMDPGGQTQAAAGASAIDQMISGDFVESETPSRTVTPPGL